MAKPMIDHLLTIKTAVDTARGAGLAAVPAEDLDRFRDHPDGINALDALRRVFLGDPFIPAVNTS